VGTGEPRPCARTRTRSENVQVLWSATRRVSIGVVEPMPVYVSSTSMRKEKIKEGLTCSADRG
jgi:hypothetical protein